MLQPETLDYTTSITYIPAASTSELAAAQFLDAEDYWQKGTQYTGPGASPSDAGGQQYIEKSFVALPKLGELTRRHMEGVVGREPAFETVIPEKKRDSQATATKADKDEADSALGEWWDAEKLHESAQVFTSYLASTLRAYFRYDIPPGKITAAQDAEGGLVDVVESEDFRDALSMIYVEVAAPGSAYIYTDPSTREKFAFYSYTEDVPGSAPKDKKTRKCVQMSWLRRTEESGEKLPSPLTRIRIVRDDDTTEDAEVDTGGVLLVVEAVLHPRVFAPFVSAATISLNNAVNAVSTMVKINTDVAAFPEKTHVDIEQPVEVNASTGAEEVVELETGPRTAPFLQSSVDEVEDEGTGDVRGVPRSGKIFYRSPVSSSPLIEVADFFKRNLYESARQAHILNDISPTASGIARVEAKVDFANSLLKSKPKVEGALRNLLRGVRCLAAYLAQDSRLEAFKTLRDNVTCHAYSGPLTPDEKRLVLEELTAEVISRELAMVLLGVEDVEAELQKIEADAQARLFGEGYHPEMDGAAPEDTESTDATSNQDAAVVAQGLNGAQLASAIDVCIKISAGILAATTGTELLIAAGIGADAAGRMITAASSNKLTPEQLAAV